MTYTACHCHTHPKEARCAPLAIANRYGVLRHSSRTEKKNPPKVGKMGESEKRNKRKKNLTDKTNKKTRESSPPGMMLAIGLAAERAAMRADVVRHFPQLRLLRLPPPRRSSCAFCLCQRSARRRRRRHHRCQRMSCYDSLFLF